MNGYLEFLVAARAAGYVGVDDYWFEQYGLYGGGCRDHRMHDFTLVWLSANP